MFVAVVVLVLVDGMLPLLSFVHVHVSNNALYASDVPLLCVPLRPPSQRVVPVSFDMTVDSKRMKK